jgi:hypothetical protein
MLRLVIILYAAIALLLYGAIVQDCHVNWGAPVDKTMCWSAGTLTAPLWPLWLSSYLWSH